MTKRKSTAKYRSRIKELRTVPAASLRVNPHNWRRHPQAQRDAIDGVLAEVGWATAVIAREVDGGALELIDGHLRVAAAAARCESVPVLVLDVDESEAAKILATFDPISGMAEIDDGKLAELLAGIDAETEALRSLIASMAKSDEPDGAEPGEPESAGGDEPAAAAAGDAVLSFGVHRVPMTPAELASIERVFASYMRGYGSANGFVAHYFGA